MFVERREAPRLAPGPALSCRLNDLAGQTFLPAQVRDVSPAGAALVVDRAVATGGFVLLELTNFLSGYSRSCATRVLHVSPAGALFLLGGEFLHPLTVQEFADLLG